MEEFGDVAGGTPVKWWLCSKLTLPESAVVSSMTEL